MDIRDAALAHIFALTAPLSSELDFGRKRLLVVGPMLTWKDAVPHLRAVKPEPRDRLPNVSEAKRKDGLSTE